MKRLAREMQEEDPDCFKVRNDNPAEEFAFDLARPMAISDIAKLTAEAAAGAISASDDFGQAVTFVPLQRTGTVVFLDFARSALRLPLDSASVPAEPGAAGKPPG